MTKIQLAQHIHEQKFDKLWIRFQNGNVPPIYNPEQAVGCNGRRNSLTLNIRIDQPELHRRIQRITDIIDQIPGLYVMPKAYYHITVKWLGFITEEKHHDYDIEPQMLEQILDQASQILSETPSFPLRLRRVNGLGSFVIIEVEDNGAIAQIQGRFHEKATLVPNYSLEGEKWLPHLSIAGIKSLKGLKTLKAKLSEMRHIEIGELEVDSIELSQAFLQQPCPECRPLRAFPLRQQETLAPLSQPIISPFHLARLRSSSRL